LRTSAPPPNAVVCTLSTSIASSSSVFKSNHADGVMPAHPGESEAGITGTPPNLAASPPLGGSRPTAVCTVPVTRIDAVAVTVPDYGSGQPFLLHGGAGPQPVTAFAGTTDR
jgi:hypothetical protein